MVAPSVTMASLSPLLLQSSGHPAGASSFLSRLRGWHRAERCPCGDWHSGAVSQEQVSPGILRCCVPPPSSTLSISSLLCPDNKMRLWVSERRRFLRAVFWHRVRQVHTAWAEIPRCVTRCQTTRLPQRVLALFPAGLPWGGVAAGFSCGTGPASWLLSCCCLWCHNLLGLFSALLCLQQCHVMRCTLNLLMSARKEEKEIVFLLKVL